MHRLGALERRRIQSLIDKADGEQLLGMALASLHLISRRRGEREFRRPVLLALATVKLCAERLMDAI